MTIQDFEGYLMGAQMPSGQVRAVEELMMGQAAIVAAKSEEAWMGGREDIWTYLTPFDAITAFAKWKDGEPEPLGWHRHQPSNRRRRYHRGEIIQEWVTP